ncbi:MAG: VOC family protein [Actinomycetales bacterium]|jgi:hypothetical protein
MRLDHISYACTPAALPDVVQRIGSDLGAAFVDGGRHPQFGTRNFVLPLQGGCYVEVVCALEHPSVEKAPFRQAVCQRAEQGGGWMAWVLGTDDLSPMEARLGRQAVPAHRVKPDGTKLHWRQLGVLDLMQDPQLPFFVQWDVSDSLHPSQGAGPIRMERIELAGEAQVVADWLQAPAEDLVDGVEVSWTDADDVGIIAAWFSTAHGSVRID